MKKLNAILLSLAACLGVFAASAQEIPAPPTPTRIASDVFSVMGYYGDASGLKMSLYQKNNDYEQLTLADGSKVWRMGTLDYAKFDFDATDVSDFGRLHIDLYVPVALTGTMKVSFTNGNNNSSTVRNYTIPAGEWYTVDIDVQGDKGKADLTKIYQIVFGASNRSDLKTMYVGNIYFYQKATSAPVLGDIIANIGGKAYTGSADLEAFIGETLSASVSAANAETITAEFNPEISYSTADGVISFTATDNLTATITATLGDETKTATYTFTFVPVPEKEYNLYIGTTGYDTMADAIAAAKASGEPCVITVKKDIAVSNIMINSDVTIEGATGDEVITLPVAYRLAFKVSSGSLTLRNIIFDGENKEHTSTAIVSNDYGLNFLAENVTFRNFKTNVAVGLLNLTLNGNRKGAATLNNVVFQNCEVNTPSAAVISINPNLSLSINDGCMGLSFNMPQSFQPITYTGDGALAPISLYFANAPLAKATLMTGFADPKAFSTNLSRQFYAIEANEDDNCLILNAFPVEYTEELEDPTSGNGYMVVAEIAGKYYAMVYNDDNTIGAGLVNVDKDGKISLLNNDYIDFIVEGNPFDGYTFHRFDQTLIYRDGALMFGLTDDPDENTWMFTSEGLMLKSAGKYLTVLVDEPATDELSALAVTPEADKHFVLGDSDSTIHLFTTGNSVTTGVETIAPAAADADAPAEYFNLQGQRVENPANGLFIMRRGRQVSKVLIR